MKYGVLIQKEKRQMFDFRMYRTMMNEKKVKDTYKWGKKLLGLNLI